MGKHDPYIAPVRAQLWLWTEWFPCADCQQLIGNFLSKQPDVELSVIYEYAYSLPQDNAAADAMRQLHGRQLRLVALKARRRALPPPGRRGKRSGAPAAVSRRFRRAMKPAAKRTLRDTNRAPASAGRGSRPLAPSPVALN